LSYHKNGKNLVANFSLSEWANVTKPFSPYITFRLNKLACYTHSRPSNPVTGIGALSYNQKYQARVEVFARITILQVTVTNTKLHAKKFVLHPLQNARNNSKHHSDIK
jgi:hypothetical protein